MTPKKKSKPTKPKEISYGSPPINEVVCGVQFRPLEKLITGYMGLLWQKYKERFPSCREQQAIASPIEQVPGLPVENFAPINVLMPRSVFVNSGATAVVQVQRDAFYYNWRLGDEEYPRYGKVMSRFGSEFDVFESFLKEHELGSIAPVQFELSYINEIPYLPDVRVFKDIFWNQREHTFLPEPEAANLVTSFLLPKGEGRMYTGIKSIVNAAGKPAFSWNLTVKGCTNPRSEMSLEKMRAWFDNAHDWIVHGFSDMADSDYEKSVWKRD